MSGNKSITEFTLLATLDDADVFVVVDASTGVTKKCTVAAIKEAIGAGDISISDVEGLQEALDLKADQTEVDLNTAARHTHSNKALLDTYTQTEANIADAVTKKHAQNTDTILDDGGANEVTASEIRSHIDNTSNPHGVTKAQIGLENVTNDAQIPLAQKGAANGVATLGADSKIPSSQLPALAITDTFVVLDQTEMLALDAETGDIAVRVDQNKSYILQGTDPAVLADWQELLTPTDSVLSVNGQTGTVVLTTSNISEGTNQYFTNARARSAISETITGIDYDSNTGVFSITSGYAIPTTTKQGQWDTAFGWGNHASAGYLTSISGLDHNSLGNLTAGDVHTHYALLAGRSGGQTMKGGTGVTDTLVLQGTSGNGTLTSPAVEVKVGNNGATTAMTVLNNGKVGIGITNPGKQLSIAGADNDYQIYLTTASGWSAGKSVGFTFGDTTGNSSLVVPYSTNSLWKTYYGLAFNRGQTDNIVLTAGTNGADDVGLGGDITASTLAGAIMVVKGTGNVGIGTTSPTGKLDINGDTVRLRTAKTPATAGASGNQGEIAWDADYVYVCTATNTWKRSAIATW